MSGILLDAKSKEPLPFANIIVLGKNIGTVSNSEGRFILGDNAIESNDSLIFSFMGYQTLKVPVHSLEQDAKIFLSQSNVALAEIQILSKNLTPLEIVRKVKENFPKNYPESSIKQRLFVHNYVRTPFSDKNKVILKKSDFSTLDKSTFNELFDMVPDEFINYNDAIIDLYRHDQTHKILPIKGISLEEGSQKELQKVVENKLEAFLNDVESTMKEENVYYKLKTGVLSTKIGEEPPSINDYKDDSSSYQLPIYAVRNEVLGLIKNYTKLDGDNLEFISKPGKYLYSESGMEVFNGELVYKIEFKPKESGLFEGIMFISSSSFAVLQMTFNYATGKSSENIQLFGIGHAIREEQGHVIYEKGDDGYHLKYLSAFEKENTSFNRKFSVMKKEKRFLIDKELNEMKFDADLTFEMNSKWEILVLGRTTISEKDYLNVKQPGSMTFEKVYSYSPEIWKNRTILSPTEELKKYTRKSE